MYITIYIGTERVNDHCTSEGHNNNNTIIILIIMIRSRIFMHVLIFTRYVKRFEISYLAF